MSSSEGAIAKINNNLILAKDFKADLLAFKDQNYVQGFMKKFNLDTKGNEYD